MKKNLLSIIILGLLVVNIVLTTIMLFSITSSNKKTNSLISSIAQIVSLELKNGQEEEGAEAVPIENVVSYEFAETMTIPLALDEDGKEHYAMLSVALAMDSKHKDYKKYSETLEQNKGLIQGEINEVIKSHTLDDMKNNSDVICEEILERIQTLYSSDFIFKVSFKEIMWS